jgi:hypothetical protein
LPSDRIRSIAERFIAEIEQAVRAEVREAVKRLVEGLEPAPALVRRPAKTAPLPKQKRKYPPHCKYPGCTEPHKGPGRSFLCKKHFDERENAHE